MDAYFYDGIRTPFGRRAGSLALVRPDNMLAACIDALVDRAPFAPDAFEEVVAGCSMPGILSTFVSTCTKSAACSGWPLGMRVATCQTWRVQVQ